MIFLSNKNKKQWNLDQPNECIVGLLFFAIMAVSSFELLLYIFTSSDNLVTETLAHSWTKRFCS